MASRLIKIRLPFLFLFCLEMFKENCLRMSESHREARSVTPAVGSGPGGIQHGRHVRKVKEWKVFSLRLSGNLKRRALIFRNSLSDKRSRGAPCPSQTAEAPSDSCVFVHDGMFRGDIYLFDPRSLKGDTAGLIYSALISLTVTVSSDSV